MFTRMAVAGINPCLSTEEEFFDKLIEITSLIQL